MRDPEEPLKNEQPETDPPEQEQETEDDNYEETQRIDEEGNELDPDDIK